VDRAALGPDLPVARTAAARPSAAAPTPNPAPDLPTTKPANFLDGTFCQTETLKGRNRSSKVGLGVAALHVYLPFYLFFFLSEPVLGILCSIFSNIFS